MISTLRFWFCYYEDWLIFVHSMWNLPENIFDKGFVKIIEVWERTPDLIIEKVPYSALITFKFVNLQNISVLFCIVQ